ncbi:MAG: DUF4388 domain-containing protein, partial [Acidimicrobiales bacterium]
MALQGTIDTFALPDVLRLLASSEKTGKLELMGDRGSGTIWVKEGAIVATDLDLGAHPSTGSSDITEGLFQVLRFVEGDFTFLADLVPADAQDPADVEEALASSTAMLAELEAIEENVPGIECWMTLCSDIDNESVTLSRDQWRVLASIGAGTSVANLATSFELGELESLRRANDLVSQGVAEVGTNPELVVPEAVEVAESGEAAAAQAEILAVEVDVEPEAQPLDPFAVADAVIEPEADPLPEPAQSVVGDPFAGTIDAPIEPVDHFAPSAESIDPFAAPAAADPFVTPVPDESAIAEGAPTEWPAPSLEGVVPWGDGQSTPIPPAPMAEETAPPPPPPPPPPVVEEIASPLAPAMATGDDAFPPPPPAPVAQAEIADEIPAPPAAPIAQVEGQESTAVEASVVE